ncbi:MAG: hypothetical protein IKM44_02420, partial [Clostridia bacterium]|nr:hypothetical protein [Clostridia bacterium]
WSGVENAVDVLRLQGATDVPENKIFVTAYDSDGCFRSDYYTTYVYDLSAENLEKHKTRLISCVIYYCFSPCLTAVRDYFIL